MELKYVFYFIFGGLIVSLVSYFASHAKGLIAAFFANLPVITFITFLLIYFEAGEKNVLNYAKSLLIMLPPWLAYILSIILLSPKLGVIPSLVIGLGNYFLLSFFIIKFSGIKI